MDVTRSYDLPIPQDRVEEGLLVLKHKLGLEMQDVLYVREAHPTQAMTTKEKEALDATGVAIADRIENCLALHAAGDCDNNKLYMEENCAKTCRLKHLEEQDKERKAELQKHLRSTTESPESEDEELMDDEELASRRAKLEAKREGKNKEDEDAFQRALQMDAEAVTLIGSAIVRLSKYYKENNIPLGLMQAPEYSNDPDKAPETTFSGANAHQSESGGIVAILEMIKEDLQKEMKEGKADEAKAQAEYEKQSGALQDSLDAQTETKVSLEKELAGLGESISSAEKYHGEKADDLKAEEATKKALETDCDWVKSHFQKRRDSRKAEMDGLVEAKNFLAGVEAGDAVLAPGF